MSDTFSQLLSVKWRDIEFPITRARMSIAHDLAEHKPYGFDGARVESTGLAPKRFSFQAPLLNGISPGRNESWAALYPNQFLLLVDAFQKTSHGMLQHPEFGALVCKAERMDIDWDATRRGGVEAELSFVETRLADLELENDTPATVVDIGDLESETFKADLKTLLQARGLDLPPYLEDSTLSLSDMFNTARAAVDYPDVLSYRVAGKVNTLAYQVDRIRQSADRANTPLTWPVTQAAEKIEAAARDINDKIVPRNKRIAFFRVPAATTLAGVARQIPGSKVTDLIRLNPGLMRGPEIDAGTVVRYYAD